MHFINFLRFPQSNFNYPYQVLIPKFHKSPVRFRIVTVHCNTYSNKCKLILLKILKQIYDLSLNTNNTHCIKNNYQLAESLIKIKNVNNIVTYDFSDLFNNINLNDLYNIMNDLFQKYFTNLKLTKNIDVLYFKILSNFIILRFIYK